MSRKNELRILYATATVLLLGIEVLIGLYGHGFLRSYVGDVLVVILLYTAVRIVIPESFPWLSVCIFAFAILVEVSQIFPLVDFLGIKNRFIRILMGTSFAWGDILAYAVGAALVLPVDRLAVKKKRKIQ